MTDGAGPVPSGQVPPPPVPVPPPAAPPGAYGVPVGGYQMPVGGYDVPSDTPPASRRTGLLALVAALIAVVVAPIVAGILAVRIGMQVPLESLITVTGDVVWAALTPVRTLVLWVEILFWAATAIGILALALGIVATVRRRGRGAGITAMILAVLGPVVFFLLASVLLGVGNGMATVPPAG
ncbi:hypothetical protein [Microbacterium arabinogalactanolyticum]|uniref:hypothetical protein n=1 Tax=Microbacterium arabinogalactanolyticum TaxID=69365 RepID=UPI002556334A|nr:hypothetical protein [Microbacterium arabinogalactanolyticum]GLC85793.1 hypothetical protein MIAR_23790 [Microbacterium arabinogalactanolyticum]